MAQTHFSLFELTQTSRDARVSARGESRVAPRNSWPLRISGPESRTLRNSPPVRAQRLQLFLATSSCCPLRARAAAPALVFPGERVPAAGHLRRQCAWTWGLLPALGFVGAPTFGRPTNFWGLLLDFPWRGREAASGFVSFPPATALNLSRPKAATRLRTELAHSVEGGRPRQLWAESVPWSARRKASSAATAPTCAHRGRSASSEA